MKVCIAEKPSVAREIAEVLGARTKREGYIEGTVIKCRGHTAISARLKNRTIIRPNGNRGVCSRCP